MFYDMILQEPFLLKELWGLLIDLHLEAQKKNRQIVQIPSFHYYQKSCNHKQMNKLTSHQDTT